MARATAAERSALLVLANTSPCMDVLTRLRAETGPDHRRLERELDLLGPSLTRQRYEAFVCAMAGLIVPFERSWDLIPGWQEALPDYPSRRKSALLLADVQRFGSPEELPLSSAFDGLDCSAALGVAYVFEGSTLGGVVIAREVLRRLGPSCPAAYLQCYGAAVGTKWKTFCEALTAYCGSSPSTDVERVVRQAARTFAHTRDWLMANEVAA